MRTSSVLRGGDYNFTYLPIHAPILNVSWHYLVGYCRENFLTVSKIFVPVFENVGGPQILRIDFKMQPYSVYDRISSLQEDGDVAD